MKKTPKMYREKDYYDVVFAKDLPWYACDPEKSQYYPIWLKMVSFIRGRVLELGCGVGQGAQLIIRNGKQYIIGIDFSPIAIEKARKRNQNLNFLCKDIMDVDFDDYEYDTVYSSETFEHIKDDYALLRKIQQDKQIILSVPDAHAIGHMRYFESLDDVKLHYKDYISIEDSTQYKLCQMTFFVINGTMR